jgi:hypothetical protein
MNLATIPLLVVALFLMTTGDASVDSVRLLMAGDHVITEDSGALMVGEADVEIPAGTVIEGPVYQVGGTLRVMGEVRTDVVQLAGTLEIDDSAIIGDELRSIGGRQVVAADADIGRRTAVDLVPEERGPLGATVAVVLMAGILALIARRFSRTRPRALENVAAAIGEHPVITVTVGVLLTLTAIAVLVFMGFTLVLIPLALVGLLAGVVVLGFGVLGLGQLVGNRLPGLTGRAATVVGVVAVVVALQLVGLIPLVGDLAVIAALMAGVGAVTVTYFGVARFRPVELPE